jgi:hypothetical protein
MQLQNMPSTHIGHSFISLHIRTVNNIFSDYTHQLKKTQHITFNYAHYSIQLISYYTSGSLAHNTF